MSKLVAACLPPVAAATAGQQQLLSVSSRCLVASLHALEAADARVALQGLLALITGLPGGGEGGCVAGAAEVVAPPCPSPPPCPVPSRRAGSAAEVVTPLCPSSPLRFTSRTGSAASAISGLANAPSLSPAEAAAAAAAVPLPPRMKQLRYMLQVGALCICREAATKLHHLVSHDMLVTQHAGPYAPHAWPMRVSAPCGPPTRWHEYMTHLVAHVLYQVSRELRSSARRPIGELPESVRGPEGGEGDGGGRRGGGQCKGDGGRRSGGGTLMVTERT